MTGTKHTPGPWKFIPAFGRVEVEKFIVAYLSLSVEGRTNPIYLSQGEAEANGNLIAAAPRVYPDGREVCTDSSAGWKEYKRRVEAMLLRQGGRCCLCGKRLALSQATFEHQRRRGMGAAWRDDRADCNGAAHWVCNSEKG